MAICDRDLAGARAGSAGARSTRLAAGSAGGAAPNSASRSTVTCAAAAGRRVAVARAAPPVVRWIGSRTDWTEAIRAGGAYHASIRGCCDHRSAAPSFNRVRNPTFQRLNLGSSGRVQRANTTGAGYCLSNAVDRTAERVAFGVMTSGSIRNSMSAGQCRSRMVARACASAIANSSVVSARAPNAPKASA